MTKIKLCGLSRREDIEAANELRPDYIGFVFASGSRRRVSFETAGELKGRLHAGIKAVGVFVNERVETVLSLAGTGVLDMIQLHGDEDAAYVRTLAGRTDLPILQAFRVSGPEDIGKALKSPADFILLDAGAGTGMTFDWSLIGALDRPYFLAGGLTAENVAGALRTVHPYAVDTSSGIEFGGKKDRKKMAAFVAAVRRNGKERMI